MIKKMRRFAIACAVIGGFMIGAAMAPALAEDTDMPSEADQAAAMAMAVANIPVAPPAGAEDKTQFSVGFGGAMFNDAHGIAAGVTTHMDNITLTASIATDGSFGEVAFGVGAALRF